MIANVRARQDIKVWGYLRHPPYAQEWRTAQRRYFRQKRRQDARAWAVRMFTAFALVVTALLAFCSANFGSAK